MEYINHVTLNTGHARKSYPSEVSKEIYFILNRIYKDSFSKDGAEIMDGFILKSSDGQEEGIIATIYSPEGMPILTTGIVNGGSGFMWQHLQDSSMLPLPKNLKEPEYPYVADRIEMGAMMNPTALQWTGDFTRCLAWYHLAPEKIR